ncbi:MAG: ATP-binding protein [Candidatus Cloacimonadaceae bacterium]
MRFYDRQSELKALERVHKLAEDISRLSVITGRRRIGKTRLIRTFSEDKKSLYFFISRKSEELLCDEFMLYIQEALGQAPYGRISRLIDILRWLFDFSSRERLVLVLDEFQELLQINPAFFSDFQNLWDSQKANSKLHLIVSGSVYSLMHTLFMDYRQPLYGRADLLLNLKAFPIHTLQEILQVEAEYSAGNLLACYILTGGIPRYLELLWDNGALEKDKAIEYIFSPHSVFAEEGRHLLIEEFAKDYGVYFSILELIAVGKTSRPEIESILKGSVGGYLERLERDYDIISPFRSLDAKPGSRSVKYKINEPFLAFWFAYFHRYRAAIESMNVEYVKRRFIDDYPQFAGYWLERLFADIYRQSGTYHKIGTYWESGFQNEIDLVAFNEEEKTLILAEIKLQKKNIRKTELLEKSVKLKRLYPDYKVEYRYHSLEDLDEGIDTGV